MARIYVVELTPDLARLGQSLLLRHRLRAADAIHLAAALHLAGLLEQAVSFVAFDHRLREAATGEGLDLEPPPPR